MKSRIIWFVCVSAAATYLLFFPPKINTDILQLVSDPRFELVNKSLKNNIVRIVFDGTDAVSAANEFKQELPKTFVLKDYTNYESLLSPAHLLSDSMLSASILSASMPPDSISSDRILSVDELVKQILIKLSSPMSSFYSQFIEIDPLLLLPDQILELNKKLGFRYVDGVFIKSEHTAFIIADLPRDLSREKQSELVKQVNQKVAEIKARHANLEVRWSSMLRFADSSASRMETDLNFISTVASVLTATIVIFCFQSAIPFLYCSLAVLIGILAGAFAVVIFKGSIHILTLGFGCSLLGACVDYPIHYFSNKYFEEDQDVLKPITLGALTTLLSFAVLLLSGFAGLVEISLFSLGSVFASWATVYSLFPAIRISKKRQDPFLWICKKLSTWTARYGNVVYPLLCLICVVGALSFSFNDDIRLLQPADRNLLEDEKWIQEKTNFGTPSGVVYVSGNDKFELERNLHKASNLLKHLQNNEKIDRIEGKYSILPSLQEQKHNAELYEFYVQSHEQELREALAKIGYEQNIIDKVFEIGQPLELYPKEFDLGEFDGKLWSFIQVYGAKEPGSLKGIFEKNGFFYDHVFEISKILENYRMRSLWLIFISYFLIFSWFCLRYGVTVGSRNFMPTIFSALLSLSFLSFIGLELNFFSLLALVIVLGLTIDYSIFYLEGKTKIIPTSIFLSTLTTITTFGLLAFSSTPVLANFGILVATGVFFALFLTYLPFCQERE